MTRLALPRINMHASRQPANVQGELRDMQALRGFKLLSYFWTVVLYISFGLSFYDTFAAAPPKVNGWNTVILVGAVIAFLIIYHTIYLRSDNWWPMPVHRAVVYFSCEIGLLGLLVWYNPSFSGVGYAVLAHACTLLPWRQWFLPVGAIGLVLAYAYGYIGVDVQPNWQEFSLFVFSFAILLGIFAGFYILAQQRFELAITIRELKAAKVKLEQNAAEAEELAALRERTRLAREMHDSIGHALVVVNVKLEAAQRLYRRDSARGDSELEATRSLIRETMAELRRSLGDLRAPLAAHTDLPAALERTAVELGQRSALVVAIAADPACAELPDAISEALWRVARESLANVERHAAASSVDIVLAQQPGAVLLRIADDGSGIRPEHVNRPGHFGILGMRERVESLGGTFTLAARPGGGTVVDVSVPLAAHANSQAQAL